jgi:hypothetical protein
MDRFDELVGEKLEDKLVSYGNYAIEISPVYSGQFVTSWSLRPIGSGSGRSRRSLYSSDMAAGTRANESTNKEGEKATARTQIAADAARFTDNIIKDGGAILTNRAPHAKEVDKKYLTITRVRDRFR